MSHITASWTRRQDSLAARPWRRPSNESKRPCRCCCSGASRPCRASRGGSKQASAQVGGAWGARCMVSSPAGSCAHFLAKQLPRAPSLLMSFRKVVATATTRMTATLT
eukprot:386523-Lingulodinium_polyedra.AAC.1